jgi:hypothetical protein
MKLSPWFGALGMAVMLAAGATQGRAPASSEAQAAAMVTSMNVSVFDDAGLGLKTVKQAEEVASYAFSRARIDVHWRICSVDGELTHAEPCAKAQYPKELQLRFVRRPHNLKLDTAGIAYLGADGTGCYSEVFVEPMEDLHKALSVSLANVLGQAAAHEIAHLLLGTNSHSPTGIMRAHWRRADLLTADWGLLLFDDTQAKTMRKRLDLAALAKAEKTLVTSRVADAGGN